MTYHFGAKSLSFLSRVDTAMIELVHVALSLSDQDFGFTEAQYRDAEQEAALVASGASHTMHSHHMAQADGFGGAVDAVAWDGTAFVWEWPRQYAIASAFKRASIQLDRPITWGAVWDKTMTEYEGDDAEAMEAAEQAYVERKRALGEHRILVDGPHFELGRN